jgi:hypothetical protein
VPVLPANFLVPNFKEQSDNPIRFTVDTVKHTITRHLEDVDGKHIKSVPWPGGACSTSSAGGFRPWVIEDDTTLGY